MAWIGLDISVIQTLSQELLAPLASPLLFPPRLRCSNRFPLSLLQVLSLTQRSNVGHISRSHLSPSSNITQRLGLEWLPLRTWRGYGERRVERISRMFVKGFISSLNIMIDTLFLPSGSRRTLHTPGTASDSCRPER